MPALDRPPPLAVEPGPEAAAPLVALAELRTLDVNEVGVVVVDANVDAFEAHDPLAEAPPAALYPQRERAQLVLIVTSTGLAGSELKSCGSKPQRWACASPAISVTPTNAVPANTAARHAMADFP